MKWLMPNCLLWPVAMNKVFRPIGKMLQRENGGTSHNQPVEQQQKQKMAAAVAAKLQ